MLRKQARLVEIRPPPTRPPDIADQSKMFMGQNNAMKLTWIEGCWEKHSLNLWRWYEQLCVLVFHLHFYVLQKGRKQQIKNLNQY